MTLFFLTLLLVALTMAALSAGVLLGRRPMQGSCGGLGALGLRGECELCNGDRRRCRRRRLRAG